MKKLMMVLCVSLLVLCGTANANLLLNPGFETSGQIPDPGNMWGDGTALNWTKTGAVNREGWANHSGDWGNTFQWWQGASGSFYQEVAVTAGTKYELSAWYLDDKATVTQSVYTANIEWYQGATLLGTTTLNLSPLLSNVWQQLSVSGTAPTNCDIARIVFSGSNMYEFPVGSNGGEVLKVDDAAFDVIPEPVTVTLLGLGSLFLARRRK
jgi:hypothetical protein